jgi:hypothetical protein
MYPKLIELGLKEYISRFCGGDIQKDGYLGAIEGFLAGLSEKNFCILKKKFKGDKEYSEFADLLHEIEIAYLFHKEAEFNADAGAEFTDTGRHVEVKSLNEGDEERERHKKDKFSCVSRILNPVEIAREKRMTISAIENKISFHLEKANKQLKGDGLIYLVWDYNLLNYTDKRNATDSGEKEAHEGLFKKEEVDRLVRECVDRFVREHPRLEIKHYYFADIRDMIKNQSL